ncbi:MAG: GNAT family N-acetyltransferase [Actinophytocola sp.]|uniref:GNAT family N-acetyltransferase n=1 Tax=Actinophytocola sp. TaxID=1872138 RepID=UPI001324FBBD|nr:GNAT family N-acetyltransferase [Actinophytocola sp.]MPZ80628.1 GNAT family N-acetyltransferase [Actinophytocola sp.]
MAPASTVGRGPLVLRRWRDTDVDELRRVVVSAQPSLRPWMPWSLGTYDRTAAADFLAGTQASWERGKAFSYAITVDGAVVGACGLANNGVPNTLEIGYWLHPSRTGRGYATEATAALVGVAFTLSRVNAVQIWHDAANTASEGVPRRLGFTEVARRTPPREMLTSGEVGVDVVWELRR